MDAHAKRSQIQAGFEQTTTDDEDDDDDDDDDKDTSPALMTPTVARRLQIDGVAGGAVDAIGEGSNDDGVERSRP